MADPTTDTRTRGGMSRREMIRASAIAGAGAWAAPVIVESLASPAAAASGCSGSTVTLSWIYVLYTVGGNYYVTGFSNGGTTCGGGGSNTHAITCASCPGGSFTLNEFTGTPPNPATPDATYNVSGGGCGGAQSSAWTFTTAATSPTCGTNIVFDNGQIRSQGGATIIAAVGFGAGTTRAICPNNSSPGNSVCGIEV
jgi:hypothetical protein